MESTLSIPKADLMAKTARHLGWSRDPADWDADQQADLKEFVDSACRRVYQASANGRSFDWSWLRPASTLALASGASTIRLPDDFGGLEGSLVVTSPTNNAVWPVRLVNEQQVAEMLARAPDTTGRPTMAAIQWLRGTTHNSGQRAQLLLYPAADQAYEFRANYYVLPDALTDAFPYALGGANLAEVYLEGCLAVAEQRLDNIREDSPEAVHQTEFKKQLAAAIDQDRRNKPQGFGRNRDLSDEADLYRGRRYADELPVTFDGVQYGPA